MRHTYGSVRRPKKRRLNARNYTHRTNANAAAAVYPRPGTEGGGASYSYHGCRRRYDHRPSHPYSNATEHVGFPPTRQTLLEAEGGGGVLELSPVYIRPVRLDHELHAPRNGWRLEILVRCWEFTHTLSHVLKRLEQVKLSLPATLGTEPQQRATK